MTNYLDSLMRSYGVRSFRPGPMFPPMDPDEENTILGSLADSGLKGLNYVGASLDKALGGRAVRGVLGGNTQELASLIPFSDTLGITDERNAVSGRDLLEQWDVLGPNQEGFDWGDVGGIAAEIALDPSTYLSFGAGALSKAGVAANKAGVLPKTVAGRLPGFQSGSHGLAMAQQVDPAVRAGERLGGHIGVGLPFMGNAATFDLGPLGRAAGAVGGTLANMTGIPQIAKYAGSAINNATDGRLGESLAGAGRGLRSLFDTSVAEQTGKMGQQFAPEAVEMAGRHAAEGGESIAEIGRGIGVAGAESQEVRYLAEMVKRANAGDIEAVARLNAASPEMRAAAEDIYELGQTQLQQADAAGLRTKELESMYGNGYVPRQITTIPGEGIVKGLGARQPFDPSTPFDAQRNPLLDVPGGTEGFEKIVADPRVSTTARTIQNNPSMVAKVLHDEYGVVNPEYLELYRAAGDAAGGPIPRTGVEDFYGELLKKQAQSPLGDDELALAQAGLKHFQRPFGKAEDLGELLGNLSEKRLPKGTLGGEGYGFFNRSVLADLKTRNEAHAKSLGAAQIGNKALASLADPVAGPGKVKIRDVVNQMGMRTDKTSPIANILDQYVPAELADDLVKGVRAFTTPDQVKGIAKLVTEVTDFWKKSQTGPWPAFHGRNLISAAWMNSVLGVPPWSSSYSQARSIFNGNMKVPGLASLPEFRGIAGMTDELAATKIANEAFAHKITGANFMDLSGAAADTGKDIMRRIPGAIPSEGLRGVAKKLKPESWDLKGVVKAPLEAGRELGNLIEDQMRFAAFLDLRKQGYLPEVAAAKVKAAHVDYSKLTAFERKVMRPLIPFYCVPDHSEALTRNGWKKCDDIEVGEELLTYNMEGDCTEWQPCEEVAIFDCDQPIMTVQNTRHKLQFTHEHRWAVETSPCSITHSYGTYNYPARKKIVEGRNLNKGHRVIVVAEVREEDSLLTPEQARLLGWLVTDGSCRRRNPNSRHVEAVIYQHPKKFLQEVCEVAGGIPRSPHPDTGVVCVPVLRERIEEIKPLLLKKHFLVRVVTRLSTEAAKAMYDAMYKADGVTSEKRPNDHFAAQDPGVRTAFRVLATMLGKRASESERGCYVSHNRHLQIGACKVGEEHYKGRVWCPRTANGTWVMRQNDFITITGNTFARHNIPEQIKQIMQRPGGMVGTAIKASAGIKEAAGEGFMPEYLGGGAAIPIGEEDDGTQRFLTQLGLPFEQPFDIFDPSSASRTGERLLSQLNPAIKAPLEYVANKQFYSGRELDKVYSPTGNITLDQTLANLPFARAETTRRTLMDPRKDAGTKAINLLTGVKLSDVDMDKQRELSAREILKEELGNADNVRALQKFFVPEELRPFLTNEEIMLMRLNASQERRAREAAKKRKAAAGQP